MRAQMWIGVGLVLSLLFWVLPAEAGAPLEWIASRASGLVAAGSQVPTEVSRHRTELPNGSVYEYDYSFRATLRILKPDGEEQLEEATCYIKSDKKPPAKGEQTPHAGPQVVEGVCAAGTLIAAGLACEEVGGVCVAGGALVFPLFCAAAGAGCFVVVGGVMAGAIQAGVCKPPAPPPAAPPPSSLLFGDITPGSDRAPQFTPVGGAADAIPEGESWWDALQEAIRQSIDQGSLGRDNAGNGVAPDNGAITNGVSGAPRNEGGDVPTPDPNDDQGSPAPDVGGGE